MNGKQNFDFLIGVVINLLSRLGGDQLGICAQVEYLIMDLTRSSNHKCLTVFKTEVGGDEETKFVTKETNSSNGMIQKGR